MNEWLDMLRVLLLLGIANGTPIFAKKIFGRRLAFPIDGGIRWPDGHALFGSSKTVRGVLLSTAATALVAPLVGFTPALGAALAATSMLGDLLSSFIKRRMGLKPHSQALGLDQIPESALPLVLLHAQLGITLFQGIVIVVLFFVLELLLSRLLYRWHLRDRPY
jgi:CDP-2,3-bis-(O-geranylgeranyl)-sn-glycerol synthase